MVSQKYRWDFIGLSTDEKPTSETSDKVVNGSTYYCSDTSKLYVYCDGTWYERKPLGGGGGGGGTSDFNDLSNRPKYNGSDMTGSTNIPEVKTYTAGSNVAISDQNVISATDTTYSAFTGTDGTAAGVAGLVPAPATTDAGKFLKADGTWDTAGGGSGPTVVQTTGTSQADVMSQNAVTSMVFADPATATRVSIGNSNAGENAISIGVATYGNGQYSVTLGDHANTYDGQNAIAIGHSARARNTNAIAIGYNSNSGQNGGASSVAIGNDSHAGEESVAIGENAGNYNQNNTVSIGRGAQAYGRGSVAIGDQTVMPANSVRGTVSIEASATGYGYNGSSRYRLLTGVYDPQSAHDAATKGYVDPTTDSSAPTTATVGRLGQIQIDTTNNDAYMCVAVDDITPAYTWKKITV